MIHTFDGVELLTSETPRLSSARGNRVPPFSSYSIATSGLFVGLSLDANVLHSRDRANEGFYGRKVTPKEIAAGAVDVPAGPARAAVDKLHAALRGIDTLASSASRPQALTGARAL